MVKTLSSHKQTAHGPGSKVVFLITNVRELSADDTICDWGRNRVQMER